MLEHGVAIAIGPASEAEMGLPTGLGVAAGGASKCWKVYESGGAQKLKALPLAEPTGATPVWISCTEFLASVTIVFSSAVFVVPAILPWPTQSNPDRATVGA